MYLTFLGKCAYLSNVNFPHAELELPSITAFCLPPSFPEFLTASLPFSHTYSSFNAQLRCHLEAFSQPLPSLFTEHYFSTLYCNLFKSMFFVSIRLSPSRAGSTLKAYAPESDRPGSVIPPAVPTQTRYLFTLSLSFLVCGMGVLIMASL